MPCEQLAGATCVAIDVLRATTTIAQALAAGAREVLACLEVSDAVALAATLPRGEFVLGGERHGLTIPGFDLGNSPTQYTSQSVGGKTVIFTTTNGTRAVLHARRAQRIVLAAFVNLSAVCRELESSNVVHVICAGTDGEITREDVLAAGALAARLSQRDNVHLNDQAALARDAWNARSTGRSDASCGLATDLRCTQGGRNLQAINLSADIDWSAHIDRLTVVPVAGEFLADRAAVRVAAADAAAFPVGRG